MYLCARDVDHARSGDEHGEVMKLVAAALAFMPHISDEKINNIQHKGKKIMIMTVILLKAKEKK